MKRLMTTMLLLLTFAIPAVAETTAEDGLAVRSFQFRHKQAEQAASAIKSLISSEGSFSVQPSTNTLVITDRPENIKAVAAAIAKLDKPARSLRLELKLVAASRQAQSGKVPADIAEVAKKLSVLRFTNFEKAGELDATGREGDPVMGNVSENFRASFRFGEYDVVGDSIQITDFDLTRVKGGELTSVLKTTLNLKVGQTVILGTAKTPDSDKALMLVLVARAND